MIETTEKLMKDLSFGDIITTRIPFEEITKDYYNGYNEYDVRGELFSVNGQRSKVRPVMVVAVNDNQLLYVSITSKNGNGGDKFHQYKVTDNSMTPGHEYHDTYVEISGVRAKYINPEKNVNVFPKFQPKDLWNIRQSLIDTATTTDTRDRYAYIGYENVESFRQALVRNNFEQNEKEDKFARDNRTITVRDNGVIHHHFERTIDEVRMLVEEYEGIQLTTLDDITCLDNLVERDISESR